MVHLLAVIALGVNLKVTAPDIVGVPEYRTAHTWNALVPSMVV